MSEQSKNNKQPIEIVASKNQSPTPEIAGLAKKRVISATPAIIISTVIAVLLFSILYFFFFKSFWESKPESVDATNLKPEISKKEFIFKSPQNEAAPPALAIENKPLIVPKTRGVTKPVFKKYKSISVKAESAESINAADRENREKKANENSEEKELNEVAVRAERIAIDPNFLLLEGTYIPCSLITRFTSDVTGRISCNISEDIYSASGKVKLIEKGTKAIGVYKGGDLKHGVSRMFVIWTKLITPDFKRIKLVDSSVVGQLGESGIEGWVDSHFFQRFGGAILLSTVKDILKNVSERSQKKGESTTLNINTMSETKEAFASIVEKMLESSVNIPPTMYKNQGDIIGIMVGRDIDFSHIYKLKIKND